MSEQREKLTTREQLQLDLAEAERNLAESQRDSERSNRKLEELNKRLVEAKEELNTFIRHFVDINKTSFEAMKHLTTLSAGSIVLLVTFLERLFTTNRQWIGFIAIALISFVVSIICAMFSMTQWSLVMTLLITAKREEIAPKANRSYKSERAAFLTFLIGIICLVVFALKNLY